MSDDDCGATFFLLSRRYDFPYTIHVQPANCFAESGTSSYYIQAIFFNPKLLENHDSSFRDHGDRSLQVQAQPLHDPGERSPEVQYGRIYCLLAETFADHGATVKFYEFLGMKVIDTVKNPDNKFDLYFLAFDSPGAVSQGADRSDREGLIELTHNYGTESDANYKVVNGNTEPYRGFGHVAISVDNIQAACKRIEDAGYTFKKKLTDGSMRSIAFVLDPDEYWVEIIVQKPLETTEDVTTTDVSTYRMVRAFACKPLVNVANKNRTTP